MTRALVPIADGSEEMEAVIIIDVLRRAGWDVLSARVGGVGESPRVTASRDVVLFADTEWSAVEPIDFDVMIIPGGLAGTQCMAANESVLEAVRKMAGAGKLVCAICAGPLVLQAAGILDGRKVTCHPGVSADLTVTERSDLRVVKDGPVITSQGPGTAMEFALAIVEHIDGEEQAKKIAVAMVFDGVGGI